MSWWVKIYLVRHLTFWLSPKILQNCSGLVGFIKGFSKVAIPLTSMLRIVQISDNLLMSVDITKKNEVIGKGVIGRAI